MSRTPLFQEEPDQEIVVLEDSLHKSVKFYVVRGTLQGFILYVGIFLIFLFMNILSFGNLLYFLGITVFSAMLISWISAVIVIWLGPSPSFADIKKYFITNAKPLPVDTAYKIGLSRFIRGLMIIVLDTLYTTFSIQFY